MFARKKSGVLGTLLVSTLANCIVFASAGDPINPPLVPINLNGSINANPDFKDFSSIGNISEDSNNLAEAMNILLDSYLAPYVMKPNDEFGNALKGVDKCPSDTNQVIINDKVICEKKSGSTESYDDTDYY